MDLPRLLPARLERDAEVEAQRADRGLVADAEADAKLEVGDVVAERRLSHLAHVHERDAADLPVHRGAELEVALEEAPAADRVAAVGERPDLVAPVAARAVDAAREEAAEERKIVRRAEAVAAADAHPAGEDARAEDGHVLLRLE